MEYLSPVIILTEAGIDLSEITTDNLGHIQKRLLLEIGLSDSEFLQITSHHLSKDDILKLFEDLTQEQLFNFHFNIYNSNVLLDFLTKGLINENLKTELSSLCQTEGFTDLISPYLSHKINRLLRSSFLNRDFERAELLSSLSEYLSIEYQSAAFDLFAGELKSFIREITALYHQEIEFMRKPYEFLLEQSFIRFINFLPEEFHQRRNHLASRLNDLGTVIHEKDLKFTIQLYRQLQYIRCETDLEDIIRNNLNYVNSIKNKDLTYTLISIAGFALILFLLFKFVALAYLTAEDEKFNKKQSPYFMGHLYFTEQIRNLTASIKKDNIDTSQLISVPDYPYFKFYSTLNRRTAKDDIKVNFKNESDYELVIFSLRKAGPFSLSVKSKSVKTMYLSVNDLFNIYAGNSWLANLNTPDTIVSQSKENELELNNGLFLDTDEPARALFEQYYKIGNKKVHFFNLDMFSNDSINDQSELYQRLVAYNASNYIFRSDSVVMDSLLVTISNPSVDSVIQMTPYVHFLK